MIVNVLLLTSRNFGVHVLGIPLSDTFVDCHLVELFCIDTSVGTEKVYDF